MPLTINPKTPPTVMVGSRGPENLVSGRLMPDVKSDMVEIVNMSAPFTVLADHKDGQDAQETTQYEFTWFEDDILPVNITLAAAVIAADTTFTLATNHNKRVPLNGLYRHMPSGEIVRCTTEPVTSGATAVFSRAWGGADGGAPAGNMSAGDDLFFIGTAFPDGSQKVRAISTVEAIKRGFTQIFRTSVEVTGRNANSATYAGKDWERKKARGKQEHLRSIDMYGFYGIKSSATDATTGHLITTSAGLSSVIQSKTAIINEADLDFDLFVDIAKEALQDGEGGYLNAGSRTKFLFCPMAFWARCDKTFHDKVWYKQDVEIPGIEIRGVKTSAGTLMFVYTPVLDDMAYVVNGITQYDVFIVDMNHVALRYHAGRNTRLLADRQGPSEDTKCVEWFSDKGWQIENERAHMKLTLRQQ